MLEFIFEEVKKTLDGFYNLTGMIVSLYDENMNPIYHNAKSCRLCRKIHKIPELDARCSECDENGLNETKEVRKTHIYKCHAGLTEAYIPISHNNIIVGYMRTGQILCEEDIDYAKAKIKNMEINFSLDEGDLLKHLDELKVVSKDYINSFVDIIEKCTSYLYLSNIISVKQYILSEQLKEFIDYHISQDLSTETLCKELYISKSKLYRLSKDTFGMGISEYIVLQRIEKAKKFLVSTDTHLYTIAEETGFRDQNYFSKVFKKITGELPTEYRQKHRN